MPLTAFSRSQRKELDVGQVLAQLSAQTGTPVAAADGVPDAWRRHLHGDLECPCCFAQGADLVREFVPGGAGRPKRQSFFRFTTPGHRQHCDYVTGEAGNAVPENLVWFGESRSHQTRTVRQLVCTGIAKGIFDQGTIRDMREWFFNKKVEALFTVNLDSRLPQWIRRFQRLKAEAGYALPAGIVLTREIATLPAFSWRAEASRRVLQRYAESERALAALFERRVFFGKDVQPRLEALIRRFQGRPAFDPQALSTEYRAAVQLGEFIGFNYEPLKKARAWSDLSVGVLAFSALLLYRRGWNFDLAIADFATIAASLEPVDEALGNVMGLNPFHDYDAWRALRALQGVEVPIPADWDVDAERRATEAALRAQFGAPPMDPHDFQRDQVD